MNQISLNKSFVFLKEITFICKKGFVLYPHHHDLNDLNTMSKFMETWKTQKSISPHHLITRSRILEEKELVLAQMKTPQEPTLCVSLRLPITSQAEFSPI